MELLIALLAFAFGGWFLSVNKARKAETEAKLARAKAADQALKEHQEEIQKAVETLNAGIEKAKAEREAKRLADERMTLKERAERYKKEMKKG